MEIKENIFSTVSDKKVLLLLLLILLFTSPIYSFIRTTYSFIRKKDEICADKQRDQKK